MTSWAFLDLETTGASARGDRITEIGLIRVDNGVEVDQWSQLVNPGMPIPSRIQHLTGITNRMVAGAPAFADIAAALLERARMHEFHPLPGYTHLQRAMPSSVGMFFGAHAQALIDNLFLIDAAFRLADACPLGSGASYGVGLPLDRAFAASLLGFSRSGGIAMADANSRGKVETAEAAK